MRWISRAFRAFTLLALAAGILRAAAADEPAKRPGVEQFDLEKLIAQFKPPYQRPEGPADPAITFQRVDVVFGPNFMGIGAAQSRYLSIGRDGSYLFKIGEMTDSTGNTRPGSNLLARLSPERLKELQRLIEATAWLTAAGGEGIALHTDAATMHIAVRRDDQSKTATLEGTRPEPYRGAAKILLRPRQTGDAGLSADVSAHRASRSHVPAAHRDRRGVGPAESGQADPRD